MTLDQAITATCTAVQPFIDRDQPNPREVAVLITEVKRMFDEEPPMLNAFVAVVHAIAIEARKGYVKVES